MYNERNTEKKIESKSKCYPLTIKYTAKKQWGWQIGWSKSGRNGLGGIKTRQKFVFYVPRVFYSLLLLLLLVARYQQSRFTK